jgi:hypothetical protein
VNNLIKKLLLTLSFLSLGLVALVQPTFALSVTNNGIIPDDIAVATFDGTNYSSASVLFYLFDDNSVGVPVGQLADDMVISFKSINGKKLDFVYLVEMSPDYQIVQYFTRMPLNDEYQFHIQYWPTYPDMEYEVTFPRNTSVVQLDEFTDEYLGGWHYLWLLFIDIDNIGSYQDGYNAGIASVDTSHYYDLGQNDGYNSGYTQGLTDGSSGQFSVGGFFNSLFGADGLGRLFNIQFGDVTLGEILLIPLILALIPFILGLFKGRGKD